MSDTNLSPIRKTLVSKGFDDKKIGWDDSTKTVTYNGQKIIKPQSLTNGTSYASASEIDRAADEYRKNNATVPVREILNKNGFINDRIGYNTGTGYITYNGEEVAKPAKIENGVSYMTKEDSDRLISSLGAGFVNLGDYAAASGMPGGIKFLNDKTATVNGVPIDIQQIKSDGNKYYAYVKKSDFDNIYDNFKNTSPNIISAWNDYGNNYKSRINKALEKVENPPEFKYSLEDDPAYKAYLEAAVRNGNSAYEDTLAKTAAMTGGYANTYSQMAAAQAKQAYLDALNDRIPELYQAAYNRYTAERERELNALSGVLNTSSEVFGNDLNSALYYNQIANDFYDRNYNRQNDDYNLQKEEKRYNDEMERYNAEKEKEDKRYEEEQAWNRKLYNDELAENKKSGAFERLMALYELTGNYEYLRQAQSLAGY